MTVLVTGATGFLGRAVMKQLRDRGWSIRGLARTPSAENRQSAGHDILPVGPLEAIQDWSPILTDISHVIHLAGRAHKPDNREADPLSVHRAETVAATVNLAQACRAHGIGQFVFVSSIAVYGLERSNEPISEVTKAAPVTAYGRAKYEAEIALQRIFSDHSDTIMTILRPPLVYGPGVKGNLARLMALINRGIPLPLAAVGHQRSIIGVTNLADLIVTCLEQGSRAGGTYIGRDLDIAVPELVRVLARGMNRSARLFPMPEPLLAGAARLARQQRQFDKLCGPLIVDDATVRASLTWSPPTEPTAELEAMARDFARA